MTVKGIIYLDRSLLLESELNSATPEDLSNLEVISTNCMLSSSSEIGNEQLV
jgi:hypothetical protein